MAVTQTTVTGPIYIPNLTKPENAKIVFELSSWDREEGEATFVTGPFVGAIDENGDFSVNLFTTTEGENQAVYHVSVTYLTMTGKYTRECIGTVALAGPGPYNLADLNFVDPNTTASFDLLAEVAAYSAQASQNAELSAADRAEVAVALAEAESIVSNTANTVRYDINQVPDKSDAQRMQARENIGGGAAGMDVFSSASVDDIKQLLAPQNAQTIKITDYLARYSSHQLALEAAIADAFSVEHNAYGAVVDCEGVELFLTQPKINPSTLSNRANNYKDVSIVNGIFVAAVDDGSSIVPATTAAPGNWVASVFSRGLDLTEGSNDVSLSTDNLKRGMCLLAAGGAPIAVGSGICRETYITEIVDGSTARINIPAYRNRTGVFFPAADFPYMFDFADFEIGSRISFINNVFRCNGVASGIRGARNGIDWKVIGNTFRDVKDRLLTDWGFCFSGALIISNVAWSSDPSETRGSYGITVSDRDCKVYFNRIINFLASFVGHGGGYTIVGNHNWQGGSESYKRQSAYLFTNISPFTTITGNYIDNGGIEISNEGTPAKSALNDITISGNILTHSHLATTDSPFIKLTLVGYDTHTSPVGIDGFCVTNNTFRKLVGGGGSVQPRPDELEVFGIRSLDADAINGLFWKHNTYRNITLKTQCPDTQKVSASAGNETNIFTHNFNRFPFGLDPKNIVAVSTGGLGGLRLSSGALSYAGYTTYPGFQSTQVVVRFADSVSAETVVTATPCQI